MKLEPWEKRLIELHPTIVVRGTRVYIEWDVQPTLIRSIWLTRAVVSGRFLANPSSWFIQPRKSYNFDQFTKHIIKLTELKIK